MDWETDDIFRQEEDEDDEEEGASGEPGPKNKLHRRDTPHHLKGKRINTQLDKEEAMALIANVLSKKHEPAPQVTNPVGTPPSLTEPSFTMLTNEYVWPMRPQLAAEEEPTAEERLPTPPPPPPTDEEEPAAPVDTIDSAETVDLLIYFAFISLLWCFSSFLFWYLLSFESWKEYWVLTAFTEFEESRKENQRNAPNSLSSYWKTIE